MSSRIAAAVACLAAASSSARGDPPRMTIEVDLSEAPRRLLHARLHIPARPGPLALVYPKWIPGEHGPTGPIVDVAGLVIAADGRRLAWARDEIDMYKVRVQVPGGAKEVEVSLDLLSPPPAARGFSSGASASASLAVLSWNQVLLYPEGSSPRELIVEPSLRLPLGWGSGTALAVAAKKGDRVRYRPVSLETLVDSPVTAGAHFRRVRIGPEAVPHFLEMTAETEEELELRPEQKAAYDKLVAEALVLYGAHHYASYHFLLTQSDAVAHFGLEHHQSSDDRVDGRTLLDRDQFFSHAALLPHEFTHSWNGKFRRPQGLATADYQRPMKGELLWVYEGLTQHLGHVLAARSGLITLEQARDEYALVAAAMAARKGRSWRDLEDTAVAAQILYEARPDWASWRRSVDFYPEGDLLWLEVDTFLRERSNGARTLDDFCRLFLGGESGAPAVKTYDFGEVVATLSQIAPHDWAAFFRQRLSAHDRPPLDGLERAGWKLAYAEKPTESQLALDRARKVVNLASSIGIEVDVEKAALIDVIPGSAADKAGLAPQMKLVAVNGLRFTPERLREAVAATKGGGRKIELLVENADFYRSVALDYQAGGRYPRLARDDSRPDLLAAILAPRTGPWAVPATQGTPRSQEPPASPEHRPAERPAQNKPPPPGR